MRAGSAVCGSDGQWVIEDPDCRGIFVTTVNREIFNGNRLSRLAESTKN